MTAPIELVFVTSMLPERMNPVPLLVIVYDTELMVTPGATSSASPTVPLLSIWSPLVVGEELLEQLTTAAALSAARTRIVALPKDLVTMTSDCLVRLGLAHV